MNIQNNRIINEKIDIDYQKTKDFFKERSKLVEKIGKLSVTMYQDNNLNLVSSRDLQEKEVILPLLNLDLNSSVLDIGCGVGRWGFTIIDQISSYLGTDFSEELINIASEEAASFHKGKNILFQELSCENLSSEKLIIRPPFSQIIIAGVFAYLNDQDCLNLLAKVSDFLVNNSTLYIREPIAINDRLTLVDFFSPELNTNYNAIYRTENEYLSFFSQTLNNNGITLCESGDLYPKDLENRKETKQKYFIFRKLQ